MSFRSHIKVKIEVFPNFLLVDGRIRIRTNNYGPHPDPGDPKTYGSGALLKGEEYSERLSELGLQRHQADMAMVHKILRGRGSLNSSRWFQRAADSVRATRSTANPRNLEMRQSRLEIRRNVFSNRVVSSWNGIPSTIWETAGSENFQRKYKELRSAR
jgi:hypothetical protein